MEKKSVTSANASVAVAIPTYNRAGVLERALDSVLTQTRQPDEIIIADDGSTDGTAQILAHYRGNTVLRYFYQPNRGVSAARNLAIANTRCDWIAFLDSDDYWLENKLERQFETLPENMMIAHCDEIWVRDGRRVNPMKKHCKTGGNIYRRCLPLCRISPSAVIIHRRVFERIGLFDETLPACEDYDLWLRICAQYPVHYLDERLLVKTGGHADQLSRKYWGMDRFRINALEKMLAVNSLGEQDREATLAVLVKKCGIYATGAQKRRRYEEAACYQDKRNKYLSLMKDITL